jgi:penicillin-binding protein 1C
MHNISGVTGCGPLFKDIMLLLENKNSSIPFAKAGNVVKVKICPLSGNLATKHCPGAMEDIFILGTEPREYCTVHKAEDRMKGFPAFRDKAFEIAFPRDRDVFKMDPILRPSFQRIKLKATIPDEMDIDRVEWWIGNQKIGEASYPFSLYWDMKPGLHQIKAIAIADRQRVKSSSVEIKVEE